MRRWPARVRVDGGFVCCRPVWWCIGAGRVLQPDRGPKTSDRCDTDLVLGALEYAVWSREVRDGQLIHHSDKGSNYTSFRFSQRWQTTGSWLRWGPLGTVMTLSPPWG
jgi:transposase InsO family protein